MVFDKENAQFLHVFAGKTYDALQANANQISKNGKWALQMQIGYEN